MNIRRLTYKFLIIILIQGLALPAFAASDAYTFTYQGYITDSSNNAVPGASGTFTFQIYDPSGACLIYEETQAITADSSSMISARIGSGTRAGAAVDGGGAMASLFKNGVLVRAAGTNCGAGYTSAAGDGRLLRVSFGGFTFSPDVVLSGVPRAMVADNAEALQGMTASQFIQVSGNVTQANMSTLTGGGDASALHSHLGMVTAGTGTNFSSVGIGTATPGAALDIYAAAPAMRITGSGSAGNTLSLDFYSNAGATNRASIKSMDNSNVLNFYTGGTQALQLDASQNAIFTNGATFGSSAQFGGGIRPGQYTTAGTEPAFTAFLGGLGATAKGYIWYNSTSNNLRYWDGAAQDIPSLTYVNSNLIGKALPAAPAAGQNGQALRWNNGLNTWEYYSPSAGSGDFMKDGSVAATGNFSLGNHLINNLTDGIAASDAATVGQVNVTLGSYLLKSGGTMTGSINMGATKITNMADPTAAQEAATKNYVDTNFALSSSLSSYLPKAGGTMTGSINMGATKITNMADPTAAQEAATKNYVDTSSGNANYASAGSLASYLPLAGGNMTGALNMNSHLINNVTDPAVAQDAATKNYVDTKFMTKNLPAAPAAGQNMQALRWNNGTTSWEFFTPSAGAASSGASGHIQVTDGAGGFNSDAGQFFWDTAAHRLGIGTSLPVDSLSFGTAPSASATNALVNLSNSALAGGSAAGTYIGANPAAFGGDFVNFQVGGANRFSIASMGQVKTSFMGMNSDIYIANNISGQVLALGSWNGYGRLDLGNNVITNRIRIHADPGASSYFNAGNVGIGNSSPSALLDIGLNGTTAGVVKLESNTAGGSVTLRSPASAVAWTMTLPPDAGTNGYILKTDGAGNTSWVSQFSGVTGSGTVNAIPKFTAASTVGDSQITDNGANVGIGIAPGYKLDVNGDVNIPNAAANGYRKNGQIILNHNGVTSNIMVGAGAAPGITGTNNTAVGNNSLVAAAAASNNTAVGQGTLATVSNGSGNTAVGATAGQAIVTNSNLTAIGFQAGKADTVGNNTYVGSGAGLSANASGSTMVGYLAGTGTTSGINNSFFGNQSGNAITTQSDNTFMGYFSGKGAASSSGVVVGSFAGGGGSTGMTGNYNTMVGWRAGYVTTTGSSNVFVGETAGNGNTTGSYNTFLGDSAGKMMVGGGGNTAVGASAGFNNTTSNNTYLGYNAGYTNSAGGNHTFVGYSAGYNSTGSANTLMGFQAAFNMTTGFNNTIIGSSAGNVINTGNDNVIIGKNADTAAGTSNGIALGSGATASANGSVQIGSGGNNNTNTVQYQNVQIANSTTGSTSAYVGLSAVASTGALGGYSGAKASCNAAFAGSHVCTNHEIIVSLQYGIAIPGPAWYMVGDGYATDCTNWTSGAGGNTGTVISASSPVQAACNNSYKIACCR